MPTLTNPTLTATICTLEHRAWAALCDAGSALFPLLSASPVLIFPGDRLFTATSAPTVHDILQDPSFKPWENYTLSHDEVVPLGDSAALVYYRVEATRESTPFRAICSSAWVLEGGHWKMVSHQQTLI
ncbi:hypothetical protein BU23DRAFT_286786 [Bimuria novae-zelandiae CBS 107.79]|uniref:DUF4440 domain-containing protein n=1 Tax=Bimuria novae-zelandiae CBS 107.79 TaxID=1447943 RepID=A0A6A5URY8_9PLEO|nr:hypothetical protein BU23DRAFT_286786 [Bimuria novae-zelandiae CBS 107.79]